MESIVVSANNDIDEKPGSLSKQFWKYIKHCRQEKQGIAPLKYEGTLTNNPEDKANILNKQFQSVFSKSEPPPLNLLCRESAKCSFDCYHSKSKSVEF